MNDVALIVTIIGRLFIGMELYRANRFAHVSSCSCVSLRLEKLNRAIYPIYCCGVVSGACSCHAFVISWLAVDCWIRMTCCIWVSGCAIDQHCIVLSIR